MWAFLLKAKWQASQGGTVDLFRVCRLQIAPDGTSGYRRVMVWKTKIRCNRNWIPTTRPLQTFDIQCAIRRHKIQSEFDRTAVFKIICSIPIFWRIKRLYGHLPHHRPAFSNTNNQFQSMERRLKKTGSRLEISNHCTYANTVELHSESTMNSFGTSSTCTIDAHFAPHNSFHRIEPIA